MYTKEQASAVRQKFWISFGQYMKPVPSAIEEKVNWVNYKTGIKGIGFKMDADNNKASVIIEISLNDKDIQNTYFDVFESNEKSFIKLVGADWVFEKEYSNEYGKKYSRISSELYEINIFREKDWPTIIAFLKTNIIALDTYWAEYKIAFEMIA